MKSVFQIVEMSQVTDAYEVEAESVWEAIELHKAGKSNMMWSAVDDTLTEVISGERPSNCEFCGIEAKPHELVHAQDPWDEQKKWVCVDATACAERGRA